MIEKNNKSVFILFRCDDGYDETVVQELKQFDDVTNVEQTHGAYDVIAKLESKNKTHLKDIIATKIRNIHNVKFTLTLWT